MFTTVVPFYIKRSSASMFNISLVSQIFWSYLYEVIRNIKNALAYEYYIGFVIIIFGIYLFNKNSVIAVMQESSPLEENLLERRSQSAIITSHRTSSIYDSTYDRRNSYNQRDNLHSLANKYLVHDIN